MALDALQRLPASEDFRDAFARDGYPQPVIVWQPRPPDFPHPALAAFAERCDGLRDAAGLVAADAFDRLALDPFLPHLSILRPRAPDGPFEFTYVGAARVAAVGRDLTGQTTEALDPRVGHFLGRLMSASVASRLPVLGIHVPPAHVFARTADSLIEPLVDARGKASRLALLTIYDNDLRPGLDALPDPAFVVRPDGVVVHGNAAATRLFGPYAFRHYPVTLMEYTGLDVDLHPSGRVEAWAFRETTSVTVCGSAIVHMQVSARQIAFRGAPYFVVVARPC